MPLATQHLQHSMTMVGNRSTMTGLISPARLRVSGFILRGDQVAVVEFFTDQLGRHYNLPGGGLDPGESLRDGARRECLEEIGCDVTVGRLLMVAEYFPSRNRGTYDDQHVIDFIFECTLANGQEPHLPDVPDEDQTAAKWIPLSALPQAFFKPEVADWLVQRTRLSNDDSFFEDAWL